MSEADETLYGGAPGGGKTDLMAGLALSRHRKSIIFRRLYTSLSEIEDRINEIIPDAQTNKNRNRWTLTGGRILELGAMQREGDWKKWQGRPHDFIGFDELVQFSRLQYRMGITWNRTSVLGQRTRVVAGTNPPTNEDEMWVVDEWAPWLDPTFPDPADPGELRWYVYDEEDNIRWLKGPEPVVVDGEVLEPKSRTFIPAKLIDNPILMQTGYAKSLDALPKELRRIFKHGSFTASMVTDPWQVIPPEWVTLAQERWERSKPEGKMTALGVDPARGGKDKTLLAPRYRNYVDSFIVFEGKDTPDGPSVAAQVLKHLKDGARAVVDIVGIGSAVYDALVANDIPTQAFNSSFKSDAYDKSGQLQFINLRAEAYWKFREMLDPASGEDICLPPSKLLRRQLCAPRFKLTVRGIQIEPKEDIKARLGHSPDEADAVVMAFATPKIPEVGYRSLS